MSEGWDVRSLGELCTIKPPKAEARSRLRDTDPVSFVPMEDLGIGVKALIPTRTRALGEVSGSYTYFADGDVLLAKITPCFENGKLGVARGLVNGIGFGSSEFIVLRPGPDLEAEFLYYYLARPSFLEEGARSMTGAVGHKRVAKEFIEAYPVPLPSRSEQRRIVAILDEAFEGIATAKAHAEKNLQNAREVFEGHLMQVFSARHSGWADRVLGSLCHRITVGHVGSMANAYKPSGVPFLRSQNIRPFTVSIEKMVFIDEEFHTSLEKSSLAAGDVAIVRTGYPGTAAVIPESLGVANCSDLVIVKPGPEVDPHFLAAFFNSSFGKIQVGGKLVGAAQKHFNVGAAKEVTLHLPPIAEQRIIVAAAMQIRDETEALAELHQRKLFALDELKRSLLHQAFSGAL